MEQWIARSTVEREDKVSNPEWSFDDNHAKENYSFWALFPRIYILHLHITTHLHPAIAYYPEFNTQLSITAYVYQLIPKNGVFAVQ